MFFPDLVQFITTLVVVDRLTGRGCCCAVSEDPLPPLTFCGDLKLADTHVKFQQLRGGQ